MTREISPEEKLLALIRQKDKKSVPDAAPVLKAHQPVPAAAPVPASVPLPAAPPRALAPEKKPSFAFAAAEEVLKNRFFEPSRLSRVNKVLLAVCFISLSYVLVEFIFIRPYKNVESRIAASQEARQAAPEKDAPAAGQSDYGQYAPQISGKNIFSVPTGGSGKNIAIDDDISSRLGLVGIIAGANPQAVIEDKKNQKTYYVTKGQSFDTFIVDEIEDGRVILDQGGRKIALVL